ncbi:MAG: hypothetical protein IJ203_13070 [Atopobiaceae bacterium]|nr:hypothetical protein [Atopobiaceae bacterium]
MIWLTGDTHRWEGLEKLGPDGWPEGQDLTREDLLVVLGDFGGIWTNVVGRGFVAIHDRGLLAWWEDRPWTTLFVDGNHENHGVIDAFPVSERFGGRVQVIPGCPHLIHLMRGEVYDLPLGDGSTARCFVMGGAESTDRMWRTEGMGWWAREMPSDEEYARAEASLDRAGWSVDYVLTHDLPYNVLCDWWRAELRGRPERNELTGFLHYVDERLDWDRLRMWYAGHHHRDVTLYDGKHCVLYQSVVRMGEKPEEEGGDA